MSGPPPSRPKGRGPLPGGPRLLQPVPLRSTRFRSHSSAITFLPSATISPRLAVLAGLERLPPHRQTLQPDQADPRPAATVHHNLDRPALRLPASPEINIYPGSSSGSAAAVVNIHTEQGKNGWNVC